MCIYIWENQGYQILSLINAIYQWDEGCGSSDGDWNIKCTSVMMVMELDSVVDESYYSCGH